jgi:hypothetical protein
LGHFKSTFSPVTASTAACTESPAIIVSKGAYTGAKRGRSSSVT